MKLQKLPHGDLYGRDYQCVFGGVNENLSASDGEIAAMENMTADHYPVLSPRGPRYKLRTLRNPQGAGAPEKLCWAEDGKFYYDGVEKGELTLPGEKRFHALNRWVTIWPDKLFYNTETDEFGSLEASRSVDGVVQKAIFCSSMSPGGMSSLGNCLRLDGVALEGVFEPGQAVTISGCVTHPENNQTLIVREAVGVALYFYDNSFVLGGQHVYTAPEEGLATGYWIFHIDGFSYHMHLTEALAPGDTLIWDGLTLTASIGGETSQVGWDYGAYGDGTVWFEEILNTAYAEDVTVTVSRTVPDLTHLCQCDNRLWGTEGDAIRCSALGDPRVWNNFDGTATGCWSAEVGAPGDFTGAFSYGGYPLLFKEDRIYRVYGTKPANFQLLETDTLGCERGSEKSFAVVGQTLYYKSRAGIVAYGGGLPSLVDAPLGTVRRQDAIAGTDGRKYYVSLRTGEGRSLYVYDTVLELWHREDDAPVMDFVWWDGELHMLTETGDLWRIGRIRTPEGERETAVESMAEFAHFHAGGLGRKTVRRVYFRVQTEDTLTLSVSYDGGPWQTVQTVSVPEKTLHTLQLIPRRCDSFRIRLEGTGDWKLWAMGREYYAGSAKV